MKNPRKKIFFYLFLPLILLITISFIYKYFTDLSISREEEFIKCPFKYNFHLYCPGCGGSRSLSALLSFDIIRSFILFPALPITVIILTVLYIKAAISFIKNDLKYLQSFNLNLFIIIPAVIILNFFIKNILLLFGIDPIGDLIKF